MYSLQISSRKIFISYRRIDSEKLAADVYAIPIPFDPGGAWKIEAEQGDDGFRHPASPGITIF